LKEVMEPFFWIRYQVIPGLFYCFLFLQIKKGPLGPFF